MSKKRILGVIGLGHVGAHAAYALAVQGIADELILVDKNAQKLASEVQDLRSFPINYTLFVTSYCNILIYKIFKIFFPIRRGNNIFFNNTLNFKTISQLQSLFLFFI